MTEKIKTDVDRLLFVLTMKKNFPIHFSEIEFLKLKLKSMSAHIFSSISQISKTKFYIPQT